MAAFDSDAFDTDAFDSDAFDFGAGGSTPGYGADTVPASHRSMRWWVPFCIALLLMAG